MKILEEDPRMKVCCLRHLGGCNGRIEWHHNLIYAGRQCDMPNTILGVCSEHHEMARNKEIKEQLDQIMLNQMTDRDYDLVSKSRHMLLHKRAFLNKKYG